MKIALVIHSMEGGGAERVSAALVRAWSGQGHEVSLITLSDQASDAYAVPSSVQRFGLGLVAMSSGVFEALRSNFIRVRSLRRTLVDFQPDVVVGMMTGMAVTTLFATRGLDIPVIVSERIYPPMMSPGRLWEKARRLTYPWASHVVMLTQDGVDWLKAAVPSARGVVIPNFVTLPLTVTRPVVDVDEHVRAGRKLLLSAGRFDSQKQFDVLISAFSGLNDLFVEWDLAILGEGPERTVMERQVAELGLHGRVMLPGRAGNIAQWYERADLYVMSSRFEGFPNVLAEAMAYGCAAVSYDCDTGPRDIIRHGIDGLLVKPVGDIHALQAALSELMRDDGKRNEMANRAREVGERFSQSRVMGMWSKIMDAARN